MPKVLLSTLESIPLRFSIEESKLLNIFPFLSSIKPTKKDLQINITHEAKKNLDKLCMEIIYPACRECLKPICGSNTISLCVCNENKQLKHNFQLEYDRLTIEIQRADNALEKLKSVPFRPFRNASAFGGSTVYGGIGYIMLVISVFAESFSLAIGTAFAIAAVPAVLIGGYHYYRGYREEKKFNADNEVSLLAKKMNIMCAHRDSVLKRYTPSKTVNFNQQNHFLNLNSPQTRRQIAKEKRSNQGNPLGHFFAMTVPAFGLLSGILLKFGIITIVLGTPFAWIGAVVIALAVGAYFAYNRYQYLVARKKFDKKMAILDARSTDISKLATSFKPEIRYENKLEHGFDNQPPILKQNPYSLLLYDSDNESPREQPPPEFNESPQEQPLPELVANSKESSPLIYSPQLFQPKSILKFDNEETQPQPLRRTLSTPSFRRYT